MSTVFLDTVGLVAVWDIADQWHAAAEGAFALLATQRKSFVTTNFVLLECGNTAAHGPTEPTYACCGRSSSSGELIVPTGEDWQEAWAAYEKGGAGEAGIVDHVSFVVMRRLGIAEAFTNDKHFQAAGFTTLF